MEISRNKVVSFHYELRNGDGAVLEDNFNDTPSLYMHGADNIISGLEKAMTGHKVGDEFERDLANTILKHRKMIDRCFLPNSVEAIMENLRREDHPFAA